MLVPETDREDVRGSLFRTPGRPHATEIATLVIPWPRRTEAGVTAPSREHWPSGYQVGRGTIANILKEHGLEPAPERKQKPPGRSS